MQPAQCPQDFMLSGSQPDLASLPEAAPPHVTVRAGFPSSLPAFLKASPSHPISTPSGQAHHPGQGSRSGPSSAPSSQPRHL